MHPGRTTTAGATVGKKCEQHPCKKGMLSLQTKYIYISDFSKG
jgi:hypothetical protein